jgi:hypothetical protein
MKNFSFLFWAYNVIWAGLALFLVVTWRRLTLAERRLARMENDRPTAD